MSDIEVLRALIHGALDRFQARCFGNTVFDVDRLDHEMAARIARRLCEHGGPEGFMLGRQILDVARGAFEKSSEEME